MRMKIHSISIENFKSFGKVELVDLPNLVVLIGKNSSGKSNLIDSLELLFTCFPDQPNRYPRKFPTSLPWPQHQHYPTPYDSGDTYS